MRINGKYEKAKCFSTETEEIIRNLILLEYEKDKVTELDYKEVVNNLMIIVSGSYKDASDALRILSILKKLVLNKNVEMWLVEVLCEMFTYCLSGHPCKRTLMKIIDNLENTETVKECFKNGISKLLQSETIKKYGINTYHVSETLEIFCLSLQSDVVVPILGSKILEFLFKLVQQLHTVLLHNHNSNQELFNIDQRLNQILKTINLVVLKLIKHKDTVNKDVIEIVDILCKESALMFKEDILGEQAINSNGLLFPNLLWLLEITSKSDNCLESKVQNCFKSFQKHLSDFSEVSQILLCNGVLVFIVHLQKQPDMNSENLIDSQLSNLLQLLLTIEKSVTTTPNHISVAKCFLQWTITLKELKKSGSKTPESFVILDKLLNFISINLDSTVDITRHTTKDLLKNLLLVKADTPNGLAFMENLSKDILSLWNWNKRSFYVAMSCVVEYVDVELIISSQPNIQQHLLKAISDQGLVTYASHFYHQLAVNQKQINKISVHEQMDIWLLPVFKTLTEENCNKNLVVNYCLKKLVKLYGNTCMSYILSISTNLKTNNKDKNNSEMSENFGFLNVFMMCARTAQQLGLLQQNENPKKSKKKGLKKQSNNIEVHDNVNKDLWKEGITMKIIKSALVHPNNQMRIEGFMLICDNPRPSIPLTQSDVDLIMFGLPYNMKNPCPDFRQQLLVTLKKLITRLVVNHQRIIKRTQNHKKSEADIKEMELYEELFSWFFEFSFSHLFQGAIYPRRCMSLGLLEILISELANNQEAEICPTIFDIFTLRRIETLVSLLKIPYEDIKNFAINILSNPIIKSHVSLKLKDKMEIMEKTSLKECRVSCKPDICKESAYNLLFIMKTSTNPDQVALRYVDNMVTQLLSDISLAEKSLLEALTVTPMYGSIYFIRLILLHFKLDSTNSTDLAKWREVIGKCIESCIRVSIAVLPVVGNDSPEGHLPRIAVQSEMEALDDVIRPMLSKEDINEDERVEAQRVLLSCWRSSKESFLLLQSIIEQFPLDSEHAVHDNIISWKQILEIGDHLRSQLLQAKHRGAFEIASCAFKSYCHFLWRQKAKELSDRPIKWINEVTDLICNNSSSMTLTLCSTRRSAGLPFYLQALLGSDKGAVIQSSLNHVMSSLLKTCDMDNIHEDCDNETTNAMIHCLNVLRGLVKDASLGETVQPYISTCLKIAIKGFGCRIWSIRNSSTLFFSTLMNRIFGVKREKDLESSNKNRLSSQEFCTKMPGLLEFLLSYLNDHLHGKNQDKAPSIEQQCSTYPVLLVISRIYPSPTHSSNLLLSEFIPSLIRCNGCLIYKCRDMASTALCNLVTTKQCFHVMEFLMSRLMVVTSQNFIHGTLIQILKLVKRKLVNEKVEEKLNLNNLILSLHKCKWIASKNNQCLITRATYFELYLQLIPLASFDLSENEDFLSLLNECKSVINEELTYKPGGRILLETVGSFFASLYISKLNGAEIHTILSSNNHDMIFGILNILKHHTSQDKTLNISDLKEDLFNLLSTLQHCSKSLALVYDLLTYATKSDKKNSLRIAVHLSEIKLQNNESLVVAVVACWAQALSCIIEDRTLKINHVISRLLALMSNSLSPLHNDVILRRVVSLAHQKIAVPIMLNPTLYGALCSEAWHLAFMLLVDEDSDVREHASVTVYEISDFKHFDFSCVDTHALEFAISLFKEKFAETQTYQEVVCHVAKLVDNNIFQEEDLESPLFDNTVINTYMEAEILENLLQRNSIDPHHITA